MIRIITTIPPQMLKRIVAIAKREGVSRAEIIRRAIDDFLRKEGKR
jgi:metal-responsive CopG/Arc/MetJ family transcriptional regulator